MARARPRHASGKHAAPTPRRGALRGLLLLGIGVPLGVAGALPEPGNPAGPPATVLAAQAVPPTEADLEVAARQVPAGGTGPSAAPERASRSQLRVAPAPTPAAATPTPTPKPKPKPSPPPPVLPGCDGSATTDAGYDNGDLPGSALCDLPDQPGHAVRGDAAVAFVRLDTAYTAAFGAPMCLTDSYRSYSQQQALRSSKPRLAARPGTSEHGWGRAVDLACGVQNYSSAEHRWLVANAPALGWSQPRWAQDGGSKEEPWHWEYATP